MMRLGYVSASKIKCRKPGIAFSFTLIELLTVTAIISVLVALLLLTLSRTREVGRKISCTGNQKQIAMGFQMYRNEFNDYLMPPVNNNIPSMQIYTPNYHWDYYLGRYYMRYPVDSFGWVLLKKNWEAFICPNDSKPRTDNNTNRSYAVPEGLLGDNTAGTGIRANNPKLNNTMTSILGEADTRLAVFTKASSGYSSADGEVRLQSAGQIRRPHLGSANFTFLDGHVSSYRTWRGGSYSYAAMFGGM